MQFLDTNILLYAISTEPAEAHKREIASTLVDRRDNCLSVQVLQEFYVQATRPTRRNALPHLLAVQFIQTWLRFSIQEMTIAVMSRALRVRAALAISYWDAAIIAAAAELGCRELLTEDLRHGQEIDGVAIVNPFRSAASPPPR